MLKENYIDAVRYDLISRWGMDMEDANLAINEYGLSERIDHCPLILQHDDPKSTSESITMEVHLGE